MAGPLQPGKRSKTEASRAVASWSDYSGTSTRQQQRHGIGPIHAVDADLMPVHRRSRGQRQRRNDPVRAIGMVQCFRLNFIQLMAVGIRRHRHDLQDPTSDLDRARNPQRTEPIPPDPPATNPPTVALRQVLGSKRSCTPMAA